MAMEVQGSRRHQDAGVKVKFIETQFISSDAASFKAVVQRLTGKSPAAASSSQPAPQPPRPRPCRPAIAGAGPQQAAGWPEQHQAGGHLMVAAPKQEPLAAAPRLEEMHHELCDFADLFYTTATAGAGSAFPYY